MPVNKIYEMSDFAKKSLSEALKEHTVYEPQPFERMMDFDLPPIPLKGGSHVCNRRERRALARKNRGKK